MADITAWQHGSCYLQCKHLTSAIVLAQPTSPPIQPLANETGKTAENDQSAWVPITHKANFRLGWSYRLLASYWP